MKAILIIVITALSHTPCVQAQMPAPGTYVSNTVINPFQGTWRWVNGADTVMVYLSTKKLKMEGNTYEEDYLVGWHLYKRGNTIIESSFPQINNVNGSTIFLWNDAIPNNPKVDGFITDLSKSNKDNLLFLTINASHNQLIWRCTEAAGRGYAGSQTVPPAGVTLPRNMVLVKQ